MGFVKGTAIFDDDKPTRCEKLSKDFLKEVDGGGRELPCWVKVLGETHTTTSAGMSSLTLDSGLSRAKTQESRFHAGTMRS